MEYILIIGAKSELAKNIADIYASKGYSLYLTGRDIQSLSKFSETLINDYGVNVKLIDLDLNRFDTHKELIKELDTLPLGVICATGYYPNQLKAQIDNNDMLNSMTANFTGPVSVINYLVEEMKRIKKGFVVGISSVSGERGRKKNYIYGSAKSGFTTFLSGLRNELFDQNVHVMTVILGFIKDGSETNVVKKMLSKLKGHKQKILILGANENSYSYKKHNIISSSICDASAIGPVLSELEKKFGIEKGFITTLHPRLSYQNVLDGSLKSVSNPGHNWKNYSLGRDSISNLIPKNTTAVKAVTKCLKKLDNKLSGLSFRVPTANVSISNQHNAIFQLFWHFLFRAIVNIIIAIFCVIIVKLTFA